MIKVLVVDDSALVRKILTEELSRQPDIEVVGTAIDPYAARDKIVALEPDVLTLDLEMPRMDGLSFLAKLMKHFPMPVVVVSSLTPRNSENALQALRLGAVDVICKPGSAYSTQNISMQIIKAVRAAAHARFDRGTMQSVPSTGSVGSVGTSGAAGTAGAAGAAYAGLPKVGLIHTTSKIIAIGASTGGTRAIEAVLTALPADTPGIAMVQHMPPVFTATFAERLNQICRMEVREARDRERLVPGLALLAPGNYHMLVEKSGANYYVRIKQGPPVHHQRPSVDVLFHTVATSAGVNATGVLMTGMGGDGAKGMLAMKEAGSYNIVQDEATSVVFGMPKEAIRVGAESEITPLQHIPASIMKQITRGQVSAAGT